jgi:hypothetical protein
MFAVMRVEKWCFTACPEAMVRISRNENPEDARTMMSLEELVESMSVTTLLLWLVVLDTTEKSRSTVATDGSDI